MLDSFKTSLTPQIVEALICCQDWILSSHAPIDVEEKIEDLEKFEEEMRSISIESSADADHAGCLDIRKSTSGEIQFLGDKLVSWMSMKHDCTAMSSVEVEYVALSANCA
nr:zinc finger BED domain-containing protein RICESLEEPER 2-like [Tanacetum cinerariifolium]